LLLVFRSIFLYTRTDRGLTTDCDFHHTRKLPRVYPNPHDAFPNRASALLGLSSLEGVPLSPLPLFIYPTVRFYSGGEGALVQTIETIAGVMAQSGRLSYPLPDMTAEEDGICQGSVREKKYPLTTKPKR